MKAFLFLLFSPFLTFALEYEIQFENDLVKVVKAKLEPGEEVGLHRDDYPRVVVALQGGVITRLEQDGSKNEVYFPEHKAVFLSPDPEGELHQGGNYTDKPIEVIVVQLKPLP